MKVAAISSIVLAVGAAGFAPSAPVGHRQTASSSKLSMGYENELGAQKPLGFWDPLNLVLDQPQERFDRLRYVEVKHGRIAQLAVAGHIWTSMGNRLPGNIDYSGNTFAQMPTGLAALKAIPPAGLLQVVAFIGFLELFVMKDVKGTGDFPGDFRNGFDFGWDKLSEDEKMEKRAVELNNGRAAQMGILGLMVHEVMGPDPYVINSLLGYPSHFNEGWLP